MFHAKKILKFYTDQRQFGRGEGSQPFWLLPYNQPYLETKRAPHPYILVFYGGMLKLAHFFNLWDFHPPDFTTLSLLPKIPKFTPVAVRGTAYPGCQNVWMTRVSGKLSPVSTTELKHICHICKCRPAQQNLVGLICFLTLGPVGRPSRWATPLNVEVGQACYPVNRGRVKREGREGS